MQSGGVETTLSQEEGILLPKYRDKKGGFATLIKSVAVRGRFDSLDLSCAPDESARRILSMQLEQ